MQGMYGCREEMTFAREPLWDVCTLIESSDCFECSFAVDGSGSLSIEMIDRRDATDVTI